MASQTGAERKEASSWDQSQYLGSGFQEARMIDGGLLVTYGNSSFNAFLVHVNVVAIPRETRGRFVS